METVLENPNISYLYPERTHDYEFEQEYEILEVSPEWENYINVSKQNTKPLLEQIKIFGDYNCAYVNDDDKICLGFYINGTMNHPYIMLSKSAILATRAQHFIKPYELVHLIILHEIGHAIQESCGLDPNTTVSEIQARKFENTGAKTISFYLKLKNF